METNFTIVCINTTVYNNTDFFKLKVYNVIGDSVITDGEHAWLSTGEFSDIDSINKFYDNNFIHRNSAVFMLYEDYIKNVCMNKQYRNLCFKYNLTPQDISSAVDKISGHLGKVLNTKNLFVVAALLVGGDISNGKSSALGYNNLWRRYNVTPYEIKQSIDKISEYLSDIGNMKLIAAVSDLLVNGDIGKEEV